MIKRDTINKIISKSFADHLDAVVFESGRMIYSRRQMVEDLGCANFIAASNLAKVLRRLKIETPAQLFKLGPFSIARAKHIGEAAMFVATCIIDANEYDVEKWWGWKKDGNVVKFATFRKRAMVRAAKRKQEVA